jgi:hypothetical protein
MLNSFLICAVYGFFEVIGCLAGLMIAAPLTILWGVLARKRFLLRENLRPQAYGLIGAIGLWAYLGPHALDLTVGSGFMMGFLVSLFSVTTCQGEED